MKHLILILSTLLVLFLLNACKHDAETAPPSENTKQTLSDTAWLKLSLPTASQWLSQIQLGIQDIGFNSDDGTILILTNENIIKLNKNYEVDKTVILLNDLYFSQIRFQPQNKITYTYSMYDGSENGAGKYKPTFCTQSLDQTYLQTQNAFLKDSSSTLSFALASADYNFRVFNVTDLTDNKTFVRVQLMDDHNVLSSTDIPNVSNKPYHLIKAFNIKDNIGVIVDDHFYQINNTGQLSQPIVFTSGGKEIAPYNDGILVAGETGKANYLFHAPASACSFSDYTVSDLRTSADEKYILLKRFKAQPGEPFIAAELVCINQETQQEYILKKSTVAIEDMKAFWVTNNIVYTISRDGVFARMLK